MTFQQIMKASFELWNIKKTDSQARKLLRMDISLKEILLWYFFFVIISVIISVLSEIFRSTTIDFLFILAAAVMATIILGIPLYFLLMLWNQLFIKLFKGTKPYKDTLKVFTLILIPYSLIQIGFSLLITIIEILAILVSEWIYILLVLVVPISLLAFIYYLIVVVKTFAITHKMGTQNAILAGFVSILVLMTILFVIVLLFSLLMFAFLGLALDPMIYY